MNRADAKSLMEVMSKIIIRQQKIPGLGREILESQLESLSELRDEIDRECLSQQSLKEEIINPGTSFKHSRDKLRKLVEENLYIDWDSL